MLKSNSPGNSSSRKKILVLTSTFPRWPGDHIPCFVYELSKRLAKNLKVYVLAPFCAGSKTRETWDGMDVYRYRYHLGKKDYLTSKAILPELKKNRWLWALVPIFLLSQAVSFVKLVRAHRIKAVHAHWILPQGMIAVLYKKLVDKDLKVVITAHGADIFGLQKFDFLKRWTIRNCTAATVVSNAIRKELKKRLNVNESTPLHTIPMGVDLSSFSPENFDERLREEFGIEGPFLLFVGRLTEKKGLKYLIEAMPRVLEKHPATKLLIVGYGEERELLEDLACELGLCDKAVVFVGGMANTELPRFYATADLFVGPSVTSETGDREGFGLVFVEALGSACPVVTTDLPAMADIITPGKTGLTVKEKDSSDLANAIIRLLDDKELLGEMKSNCRTDVLQRFHWETISERYLQLLGN